MIILFVVPVFYGFQSHNKPKGRFFWFVEGWGCFIYLASGNQKNRPFGYVFTCEKKVYFWRKR